MIIWKDEYTMGINHIDDQHKKLFEIADKIQTLLRDQFYVDKYDQIVGLLDELKEYTIFHFKSEEEYMQSIGYKKFFTHKVDHDDFIEKINTVNYHEIDENQQEYLVGILGFVIKWIEEHILEKDKKIVEA